MGQVLPPSLEQALNLTSSGRRRFTSPLSLDSRNLQANLGKGRARMTRTAASGSVRLKRRLAVVAWRFGVRFSDWGPGSATATGIRQLHVLMAFVAPALMFATIWFMANQQNVDARRVEVVRAMNMQAYLVNRMRLLGADNANWNDAFQGAVLSLDAEWMDGNWGPDAYGTADYDDVFLVGKSGETLYASVRGKRSSEAVRDLVGGQIKDLLGRAARAAPPAGAAGFVRYDGGIALISATRVKRAGRPPDPSAPVRYLVILRRLDSVALADIGQASGFRNLRALAASEAKAGTALRDVRGFRIGALVWESDAPGYESAIAVLPIAVFVFALLAYAGFVGASTARRRADELLVSQRHALRLAHRDMLTDLPNRRAFAESLDIALGSGGQVAMLYMDLDGFKEVNDAFGHAVGDALLVQASRRIEAEGGDAIQLARFGGDEFAVMLSGVGLQERARRFAQILVDSFQVPIEAAGRHVYVGASIGLAIGDAPSIDGAELIRRADVAMYAAKAAGKRRWKLYDEGMDRGRVVRRQIAAELRLALASGDVLVSYQPVVQAHDRRIVGAEALARWSSPTLGIIDPVLFISVAEEGGMISELTRQVLRQACRAALAWDIVVSVNLSAAEVWDLAFADELLRILAETGLPANRLELEITESYLVTEPQAAAATLSVLRALGVRIVLDDFGMGFASLGQLRRLPLDRIKLTHEFLTEIATGGNASEVATAIVALARALDLPVTAEGVETEAQADLLQTAGCTHFQGWLFGKPMAAATLTRRLRSERADSASG